MGEKTLSPMKLDQLRKRLRKDRPPTKAPIEAATRKTRKVRLRCSKCRGPRVPAQLTDPDVAEIIREHPSARGTAPTAAYRCNPCGIIWLVGPL
jgi:hypothetical protein